MNIKTTTYNYKNEHCTGTNTQPDTIIYFIKKTEGSTSVNTYTAHPSQHFYGKLPLVSIFSGIARIVSAVKAIFRAIKSSNKADLKNGFKNFFRGFVEVLPLTGIPLIIFDLFRARNCIKKINTEINDQDNIVGVAIDRKVIYTLSLDKFKNRMEAPSEGTTHSTATQFGAFIDINNKLLETSDKRSIITPMDDLFLKLGTDLKC